MELRMWAWLLLETQVDTAACSKLQYGLEFPSLNTNYITIGWMVCDDVWIRQVYFEGEITRLEMIVWKKASYEW